MILNKKADKETYKEGFLKSLFITDSLIKPKLTYQEDHPWGWRVMVVVNGSDINGWGFDSYQQALQAIEMMQFGYRIAKDPKYAEIEEID